MTKNVRDTVGGSHITISTDPMGTLALEQVRPEPNTLRQEPSLTASLAAMEQAPRSFHNGGEDVSAEPPDTEFGDELLLDVVAGSESLEEKRNEAALAQALESLRATKIRTGSDAKRSDLHRVVKRFGLLAIDAAELETRAADEGLVEDEPYNEPSAETTNWQSDAVRMFLDETKRYRLLRPEEHQQLARAIAIGCDAAAALEHTSTRDPLYERLKGFVQEGQRAFQRFVASNVRLVVSIAKNYTNQGLDLGDLIQEGCFGLMRAVELYNPNEGAQFSTYAYYWIMQSITRAVADKSRAIRLPVHAHDALNQIRRAIRDLSSRFGRDPTYGEIAEHLALPIGKVAALAQWQQHILSLESPIGDDGDSSLADFIKAREPPLDEQIVAREISTTIRTVMKNVLNERQIAVLTMRFGLYGRTPMTLEAVGEKYKVTRERVRQIESKALKILKHHLLNSKAAGDI